MQQEYFSVQLSPEINLGIPLSAMGAVVQLESNNICTIPGIADFWYGVVNFKGSLIWVLDSDRYFNFKNDKNILHKKLTAVTIKQQLDSSLRKIALVTQKLVGIVSLESHQLQQFPDHIPSRLRDCCSPASATNTQNTYILNPSNLLQQLHQQSTVEVIGNR
ncbi:MAG: chemotaxis protein CheW [Waterburya sp.]